MGEFTVGRLTAKKGTKVSGFVPVEGTNIKLPVTLIYGEEEGETVLISGGICRNPVSDSACHYTDTGSDRRKSNYHPSDESKWI